MADNYLHKIEPRVEDVAEGHRRVVFEIRPGSQSQKVVLAFEGASGIEY